MKYYAVKKGYKTGIFSTWDECKLSILNYKGAVYKSFGNIEDAKKFLYSEKKFDDLYSFKDYIKDGYIVSFVDGSYDGKRYSYGVLIFDENFKKYSYNKAMNKEKYLKYNNIAGEIYGVLCALSFCKLNGYKKIVIYHDYKGLSAWISGEYKANSLISKDYVDTINKKFSDIEIKFIHVKAHSNNEYNDYVDKLAKDALKEEGGDLY